RSNVGKSSLINRLVGQRKLARVSNTPGRTRNVEHFLVRPDRTEDRPWLLADLPGYGFAKVPKSEREAWRKMIDAYLLGRTNLQCVFLLVDVRLEPQRNDLDMM
ncbi:MAG: ribosome biogenesis GTP-binding protein YsxC, partial [Flavobacteriales bacterium]|nr:ribosome biogenesis GTP-binding protein YsxC [Flavobacteriales bacterium]